jgi:hypothetical protein
MSTEEITRSTGSGDRVSEGPAHRQRGVVIVYDGRREGRAALRYAGVLAGQVDVPLTVVSIASKERTDISPAPGDLTRPRQGAAQPHLSLGDRRARRSRSLIATSR